MMRYTFSLFFNGTKVIGICKVVRRRADFFEKIVGDTWGT